MRKLKHAEFGSNWLRIFDNHPLFAIIMREWGGWSDLHSHPDLDIKELSFAVKTVKGRRYIGFGVGENWNRFSNRPFFQKLYWDICERARPIANAEEK